MGIEVKLHDYVQIKKNAEMSISNNHFDFAKENNLPLFVYNIQNYNDSKDNKIKKMICVYTDGLSINNFVQNPFALKEEQIEVMDPKEADKLIYEINKEHIAKTKEREALLKTVRVSVKNRRDYLVKQKEFITTRYNFALLYDPVIIKECNYHPILTTKYAGGHAGAECCSFSKTNHDIMVFIPKSWLNYYGYNLVDLRKYLRFLSECEIGYKGTFVEMRKLKDVFLNLKDNMNLNAEVNNYYQNVSEDCYTIFLPGSRDNKMQTYMFFILTRFIYSSLYWNIPFIAMQLKENLPEATPWECLLIAHCNENYNAYYSLQGNTENSLSLPSKYNSPKNILEIIKANSMNAAFKKYADNGDNLRKWIREGNYEEIQKIINKYRDVN